MDGLLQEESLAILGHNLEWFLIMHWTLHITKAPQILILSRTLQDPACSAIPTLQQGCFQGKSHGDLPTPCKLRGVRRRIKLQCSYQSEVHIHIPFLSPQHLSTQSVLVTTPGTGSGLSSFHSFLPEMLEDFLLPSCTLLQCGRCVSSCKLSNTPVVAVSCRWKKDLLQLQQVGTWPRRVIKPDNTDFGKHSYISAFQCI